MPTLVIENVPAPLYERIQQLADTRRSTPSDTVLKVLETAFRLTKPTQFAAILPQEPILTEEVHSPSSIPWPEGKPACTRRISPPLPSTHDLSDAE